MLKRFRTAGALAACGAALFATAATAEPPMADVPMLTNTCIACHGPGGSSTGQGPSLAGMTPNYFISAMLAFKYDNDEAAYEKAIDALASQERYEDLEVYPRYSTIMGRIARGYTDEEIVSMAEAFVGRRVSYGSQPVDPVKARLGGKIHKKACDKCHEDGGRSAEDDVGVLAAQRMTYLRYTLEDYLEGRRAMPKKMKTKMQEVKKEHGDAGVEALVHYYGSIEQ